MNKQKHNNTASINNTKSDGNAGKKITNWPSYNKSLVRRGNITLLINKAILSGGRMPQPSDKAGHPTLYPDDIILFLAQLRELFGLPLRQTTGLARSLLALAGITATALPLPDYSTVSRRLGTLNVDLKCFSLSPERSLILLPDSTGLKVAGEGEWKVRKHGTDKRRQWAKVHLAVDYTSQCIVAVSMTSPKRDDGNELPHLLGQVPDSMPVSMVIGDGAYDSNALYGDVTKQGATLLVPPPKNAKWHGDIQNNQLVDEPGWEQRNEYVRGCMRLGRKEWKHQSGYHRRSLAETAMYRLKRTFGGALKSKKATSQAAELRIRVALLNMFASYGLPEYTAATSTP